MTSKEKIYRCLIGAGLTAAGAAGLMGNLYAESGLKPKNLENKYEKSLGYTDTSYTEAVDSGEYTNFANDHAGYGLVQWTYHTRKAALLAYAKDCGKSIGDPDMQIEYLCMELSKEYPRVWELLRCTDNVEAATHAVMLEFERPADVSDAAKMKRTEYAMKYYHEFAETNGSGGCRTNKSAAELANEVLDGIWGNGEERRVRLTAAGYDYDAVQAEVNRKLGKQAARFYRVSAGDTLTKIADKYQTTISAIIAKNRRQYPSIKPDYIEAGWTLNI